MAYFLLVFSQNKVTKTVADISVSDTKLHITYSDGTSKDINMPPATSLRLPLYDYETKIVFDVIKNKEQSII